MLKVTLILKVTILFRQRFFAVGTPECGFVKCSPEISALHFTMTPNSLFQNGAMSIVIWTIDVLGEHDKKPDLGATMTRSNTI